MGRGNIVRGGKDIDSFVVVKDNGHIHQPGDRPDILLDFLAYDKATPEAAHEKIYLEGYSIDFKTVNDVPTEGYTEGTIIHLPDRDVYLPFVAVDNFLVSKNLSLQKIKE